MRLINRIRANQRPIQLEERAKKKLNNNYKLANEFETILNDNLMEKSKLKISAHAQDRIDQRDMKLGKIDLEKLEEAVNKLDKKGSKESLMFYKDMAFIASVKNRTIITALEREKVDLITNIDSTIIIK